MNEEIMIQAGMCKSPEEIVKLASEHNYSLTLEEAGAYYNQWHTEGEISDEELDNVAGGLDLCSVTVDGEKYDGVKPTDRCSCNSFEAGVVQSADGVQVLRSDRAALRKTWAFRAGNTEDKCGRCYHLAFKGDRGYCELLKK